MREFLNKWIGFIFLKEITWHLSITIRFHANTNITKIKLITEMTN